MTYSLNDNKHAFNTYAMIHKMTIQCRQMEKLNLDGK